MTDRVRPALSLRAAFTLAAVLAAGAARAADSAVVLMYHHVASDTPASTSVTPQRFVMHMDYLAQHGFQVWPLLRILEHLQAGQALPERTVAITFDDAYVSVLTDASPALQAHGWPFTVFVSTDYVDKGYRAYLSWQQLRQLAARGATIGDHSRTHPHLVRQEPGESERLWSERVRDEIEGAARRIEKEIGDAAIPVFAYPYGEYDQGLEQLVGSLRLFGVGQQSGAVGVGSDLLAVPRFPMSAAYDDLEQFALRVRTRPLPVIEQSPKRHILEGSETLPTLSLTLGEGAYRIDQLACYASNQGRIEVDWLDTSARRLLVKPLKALPPGRTKYNCTAPSSRETGVYYWYSYLWMKKNADGSWYRE